MNAAASPATRYVDDLARLLLAKIALEIERHGDPIHLVPILCEQLAALLAANAEDLVAAAWADGFTNETGSSTVSMETVVNLFVNEVSGQMSAATNPSSVLGIPREGLRQILCMHAQAIQAAARHRPPRVGLVCVEQSPLSPTLQSISQTRP